MGCFAARNRPPCWGEPTECLVEAQTRTKFEKLPTEHTRALFA
jgi:hypothetical protein